MIKRAITLLLLALPFYLAAVQQAEGRSPGHRLPIAEPPDGVVGKVAERQLGGNGLGGGTGSILIRVVVELIADSGTDVLHVRRQKAVSDQQWRGWKRSQAIRR